MATAVSGFEWDNGNWPKCGKHGVGQDEIEWLFSHIPAVQPDPNPDESRMRAIGRNRSGRYIFVVFMLRTREGRIYIRPISARYMHQKEVRHYENRQVQTDTDIKER